MTLHIRKDAPAYTAEHLTGAAPQRQGGHRATSEESPAPTAESFFKNVNQLALVNISKWVRALFGDKIKLRAKSGAWRITSKDLRRDLEEDLSISQRGVWDDGTEKGSSPIDLVLEYLPRKSSIAPTDCSRRSSLAVQADGRPSRGLGWDKDDGGGARPYEELGTDEQIPHGHDRPRGLAQRLHPWCERNAAADPCQRADRPSRRHAGRVRLRRDAAAPMLMTPLDGNNSFRPRPLTDVDVSVVQEQLQHLGLKRISKDVVHQAVEQRAHECALSSRARLPRRPRVGRPGAPGESLPDLLRQRRLRVREGDRPHVPDQHGGAHLQSRLQGRSPAGARRPAGHPEVNRLPRARRRMVLRQPARRQRRQGCQPAPARQMADRGRRDARDEPGRGHAAQVLHHAAPPNATGRAMAGAK